MKITKQNTSQATGYTDENIRECPRCHGDGLYMGNPDGGEARELTCGVCGGTGIVTITENKSWKTAIELNKLVGTEAQYRIGDGDLVFGVRVLDAKISFGNQRVQITPLSGTGTKWVDISSVMLK